MKLPFIYPLAAFTIGILAAALHPFSFPASVAFGAALLLAAVTVWRFQPRHRFASCALALAAWIALGALALAVEHHGRPANLASYMIGSGALDTTQPLRWRGELRESPERLPWGVRFDLALDEVQFSGQQIPISGGLRTSYFGQDVDIPNLRAGDRIEVLAVARVPRNFKDPGAFDYRGEEARQGIDVTASVRSLALVTKLGAPRSTVRYIFPRLRAVLLARLTNLYSAHPERAAVLRAMILGDRGFVDNEVSTAFQKTSSYHVLVIAGLHVAALAAFIVWICGRLRLGRMLASFASVTVLTAYLGIVQQRPPILRATLMAAAYLLARAFFRRVDLLQAAAVAAFAILLFRPDELADSSFQLSFLAVAAIGGIALPWLERTAEPLRHALQHLPDLTRDPRMAPRLVQLRLDLRALSKTLGSRIPEWLREWAPSVITLPIRAGLIVWETFVISAVIQLGLMPLLIDDFHRVGVIGLIANIPAVLLTAVVVPLGVLSVLFTFVFEPAAHMLARATSAATFLMLKVVDFFAALRVSNFRVPTLPVWLLISCLASFLLLAIAVRASLGRLQLVAGAAVAMCLLAAAIHPFAPALPPERLALTVLDVGQGDSLFLSAPDGRVMLIDGGGGTGALRVSGVKTRFDIGEEIVSPYLWSLGLKRIDAVVLTHAHEDHLEGLFAVLENFHVGELWVGHDVASAAYSQLLAVAQARGTAVKHLQRGDSFAWGDVRGIVIWPDDTAEVRQAANDDSLALRVTIGSESLLLTGDIEKPVERALEDENVELASNFLKVPHHGSATSSTEEFLRLVHPIYAAISVGENNPFNHPAPAVIERLTAAGAQVFRTDKDGAITVTTDGKSESVSTYAQASRGAGDRLYASLGR